MTHRFTSVRLRNLAKEQRRATTIAGGLLWRELRSRRLMGLKFRRQCPLGPYIADFACLDVKLVIELDGPVHREPAQQDRDRRPDHWFRRQGFTMIRFADDLFVSGSGEIAMRQLREALGKRAAHPSSDPASPGRLLPQGEKDRPGTGL